MTMPDLGTFLSGSVAAAIVGFALNRWKEAREARSRQSAELRGAYEEFLAAVEEARYLLMRHVTSKPKPGKYDEWFDATLTLTVEALKRLGSARSRLMILEDDEALRDRAVNLTMSITTSMIETPTPSEESDEQVEQRATRLRVEMKLFEDRVSARLGAIREAERAFFPRLPPRLAVPALPEGSEKKRNTAAKGEK